MHIQSDRSCPEWAQLVPSSQLDCTAQLSTSKSIVSSADCNSIPGHTMDAVWNLWHRCVCEPDSLMANLAGQLAGRNCLNENFKMQSTMQSPIGNRQSTITIALGNIDEDNVANLRTKPFANWRKGEREGKRGGGKQTKSNWGSIWMGMGNGNVQGFCQALKSMAATRILLLTKQLN